MLTLRGSLAHAGWFIVENPGWSKLVGQIAGDPSPKSAAQDDSLSWCGTK